MKMLKVLINEMYNLILTKLITLNKITLFYNYNLLNVNNCKNTISEIIIIFKNQLLFIYYLILDLEEDLYFYRDSILVLIFG